MVLNSHRGNERSIGLFCLCSCNELEEISFLMMSEWWEVVLICEEPDMRLKFMDVEPPRG